MPVRAETLHQLCWAFFVVVFFWACKQTHHRDSSPTALIKPCVHREEALERQHIIFIRSNPDTLHAKKMGRLRNLFKKKGHKDREKECAEMNLLNHV